MRIGLVMCTRRKLDHVAPAKDLYIGSSFIESRRIVEETCDAWFILSAKYGLLDPEFEVEPYDVSLADMPPGEQRRWATDVCHSLSTMFDLEVTVFEVHAEETYYRYLIGHLYCDFEFGRETK